MATCGTECLQFENRSASRLAHTKSTHANLAAHKPQLLVQEARLR
jgi:hypothetical protein